MFHQALQLQKTPKYMTQGLILFVLFMVIYTVVDGLNMSYEAMAIEYSELLVVINVSINVFMSLGSTALMNLSTAMVVLKGKEGKASNFGIISVLFGILTYGCTSCVIAFFASIGIAFSVVVLPFAGLPYKLISVILIIIGLIWMYREIEHGVCKVNLSK
ncbi:MAG TPA: hypothetical protein DC003_03030 [Acholeplasmataceae bacterium]|nr:hypothetical protein [Acholeplasmataceae bacterium]